MGDSWRPFYPNPEAIVYPKSIPYMGHIPGGLHDGKLIEIRGSVPYGADSFGINLCTGLDQSCDRAFHLSARFHGRIVVRNSRERNEWCEEERSGSFPFSSGRDFTIMILVENLCYRIAVNSQHCWEFYHRMPLQRVSTLLIDGNVNIERIEFIDKITPYQPGYPSVAVCPGVEPGYVPYQPPGVCNPPPTVYPAGRISPGYVIPNINPSIPNYPGIGTCIIPHPEQHITPGYIPTGGSNLSPVYNPSIPYAYPIYGGLRPGMMMYISGRPSASAYSFTVNLQSGTSPYPPPDIAFHMSARFYNRTLVRNTRINNVWEREETGLSHFPFQQSVNFDLVIRVESDRYMVALNGQHLFEFRHRLMPLERYDTLYIENDIVVSSIRFA